MPMRKGVCTPRASIPRGPFEATRTLMDVGSTLLAAIGIGLLIFLHELGHFLAARLAGVRVEVFSLGFGPRLLGRVWKGTDFRLSLVPFGGYVMVAGQDPSDRRYPAHECLWSKSIGQRALFWSGGVAMNALFALAVFPLVFHSGVSFLAPIVGGVTPGSAAWEVDLREGDRIAKFAGKEMYSFENLMNEVALAGDRPVTMVVESGDGTRRDVVAHAHFDTEDGLFRLGIEPAVDPAPPRVVVEPDGPAAQAGLQTGDLVETIDGKPPFVWAGSNDLAAAVPVRVRRGDAVVEATIVPKFRSDRASPRIGVVPLARRIQGLRPGHPLVERLGLRRGDVVLAIDDRPFVNGDLTQFVAGPDRTRWLVSRAGATLTLEQATNATERASLAAHVSLGAAMDMRYLHPMAGGAALAAGMQSGDRVERIDDREIDDWADLRKAVEAAGEKSLRITVRRLPSDAAADAFADPDAGALVDLTLQPRREPVADFGWQIQFLNRTEETRAESFGDALRLGTICSLDLVKQLYVTMKRLVTGDVGAKNLGGIIRISQVSYQAAQRGTSWFWYFLALLSVNLAFVNLLPVPILDGGYLLFLLIEKVKGSPVSTRVLGYSQVVGLVFVLLLVLFVTYNDILRLL